MAKIISLHNPNKVETDNFVNLIQSLSELNKVLYKIEVSIKNTPKYEN